MSDRVKVGLFGLGCVGQGFYNLYTQYPHLALYTKRIVVKDPDKKRDTTNGAYISYSDSDILQDAEINLLVEAINNTDDALLIARASLVRGKTLVTASKRMVAENFSELLELQEKYGGRLLYEASSAGSIPIIRLLETYFLNEKITSVDAVLNGTSNYILTHIFKNFSGYADALKLAAEKGFAESDPSLDVNGDDALHKLIIITAHAFGTIIRPPDVFTYGIPLIGQADVQHALQKGWRIRQVARAYINEENKLTLYVAPAFVKPTDQLYHVQEENNGVKVDAEFSGTQFYYGKGAGSYPTGSAVMADVAASLNDFSYSYRKIRDGNAPACSSDTNVKVYIRYPNSFDPGQLNFRSHESPIQGYRESILTGNISIADLRKAKKLLTDNRVSVIFY